MMVGGVAKQFIAVDWSQAVRILVQNNLTPQQASDVLNEAYKGPLPFDFSIERDGYSVTHVRD